MDIQNKTTYIYYILGYDTLATAITHIKYMIDNKEHDPDDVKLIFVANYIPPVYDGYADTSSTDNILKLVDLLKLYCNKYGFLDVQQYYINNKYTWILANTVLGNLNGGCIACRVLGLVYQYCYAKMELEKHNTPIVVEMLHSDELSICGATIQNIQYSIEECVNEFFMEELGNKVSWIRAGDPGNTMELIENFYIEYGIDVENDILEPGCFYCNVADNGCPDTMNDKLKNRIKYNMQTMIAICELGDFK